MVDNRHVVEPDYIPVGLGLKLDLHLTIRIGYATQDLISVDVLAIFNEGTEQARPVSPEPGGADTHDGGGSWLGCRKHFKVMQEPSGSVDGCLNALFVKTKRFAGFVH